MEAVLLALVCLFTEGIAMSQEFGMKFKLPDGVKKLPIKDEYLQAFKKDTEDGTIRINVWRNNRNDLYTVGTYMDHPTKGRNQLFRKYCTQKEVEELMNNPRLHTGKGYR